MLIRHRRRRDERGQVLVLALAFLAFFSIVTVATFGFIDTALLQHPLSERTAARDALAEGAASYAVSTVASNSTVAAGGAAPSCAGPSTGTASWNPEAGVSETLTYTVNSCIPNYLNSNPGGNCVLCILGTDPAAVRFTNGNSMVNVRGEIDVNGGVSIQGNWQKTAGAYSWNGSTLCSSSAATPTACAGTPEFIGVHGNPGTSNNSWPPPSPLASGAVLPYSPNPVTITMIADPLAGVAAPSFAAPNYATSQDPNLKPNNTALTPGSYTGMSIGGNQTVTLSAGLYVFTGAVTLTGGGVLDGSAGVTIYMACSDTSKGKNPVTTPRACNSGEAGPALKIQGGGTYSLSACSSSAACSASGAYLNLAVFQDRNSTTTVGIGGSGSANVLSGGLYAESANVDIGGNGTGAFQSNGRLVAKSLTIHVNASAGLNLLGSVLATGCDLYNASVTGTESGTTRSGQVVFISDPQHVCGGTRIASFTYTG